MQCVGIIERYFRSDQWNHEKNPCPFGAGFSELMIAVAACTCP